MSQSGRQQIIVTTGNDLPGYRVVEVLGLVRGITVRSITLGQGLSRIFKASTYLGGKQEGFTPMCEQARGEACEEMMQHAVQMGANAIIAMRYDATEISSGGASSGMTEVLAYGTAVRAQRE
ncbi:MAG: YbjQ family protein [Candidatus Sumerlaeaceae bacterium]|nr:YbjQ family protein [Candidatus Sumerlaeaceae bacterium]